MEKNKEQEAITLDTQLCFEIYQAHKTFNKFYNQALKHFGLTYAQYIVMLSLYEFGILSVKDLGSKVDLDSGTLTPLLRRLEKDDWIIKEKSKVDERRLDVSPSKKALEVKDALFERVGGCMNLLNISEKQYIRYKKEVANLNDHILKAAEQIDN